jgi:hypothetical protein
MKRKGGAVGDGELEQKKKPAATAATEQKKKTATEQQPEQAQDYSSEQYWDGRYASSNENEWHYSFEALKPLFLQELTFKRRQ